MSSYRKFGASIDPLKSEKKPKKKNKNEVLSKEIQYRLKLIEKAFR